MENKLCPLCGSASRRAFEKYDIWIADCGECGHRFAEFDPKTEQIKAVYGDDYFSGGGAGYDDYLTEESLLRAAGERYAGIVAKFAEPGMMLDIGAGAGFILKGFEKAGWKGRGVEINQTMARYGQENLGLDIYAGTIEAYPYDDQFDLVAMIQVIGHIPDPVAALKKAASLTRPGGLLLIETWRRDSWTARAFGKNWHEYSPPSVLHWFSKAGLQAACEAAGYRSIASGRPAKWINAGHARSLLKYKLDPMPLGRFASRAFSLIPASINLPYPAEDLLWMLFRKI